MNELTKFLMTSQIKRTLRHAKESNGLEQVLINTFPGNVLGFAALKGQEEAFMSSIEKSIEYCQALNCKRPV